MTAHLDGLRVLFVVLLLAAWFACCWGVWLVAGRRQDSVVRVFIFRDHPYWCAAWDADFMGGTNLGMDKTDAIHRAKAEAAYAAEIHGIDPATLRFDVREEQ